VGLSCLELLLLSSILTPKPAPSLYWFCSFPPFYFAVWPHLCFSYFFRLHPSDSGSYDLPTDGPLANFFFLSSVHVSTCGPPLLIFFVFFGLFLSLKLLEPASLRSAFLFRLSTVALHRHFDSLTARLCVLFLPSGLASPSSVSENFPFSLLPAHRSLSFRSSWHRRPLPPSSSNRKIHTSRVHWNSWLSFPFP